MSPEPCIAIARGARAAEAFLLAELVSLHQAARGDPSLLARPVRVVVPSRSLRDHLAAQLVRALGGAAAGIAIQTLHALAFELLERAGEGARGGEALVPVLVQRFAATEQALAEALADFDDGYVVVLASVNDLLEAGLDGSNAEGALECIEEAGAGAGAATSARASALVRVAQRVAVELSAHGLEPRSGFFRRARAQLEQDPSLLPTRALFLHGWADVTGVQLDLVEGLVRSFEGRVVLDHPADPAEPAGQGPGPRWTERLRLRLGGAATALDSEAEPAAPEAFAASGTHSEAREVALRVRALLDGGAAPESIGIVLREPAPYRHALFAQLGRLGIPFSGSPDALGPAGRRSAALLELIESGEMCTADRWLDAQRRSGREHTAELRLAFHGIGVGRLRDVARLDLALLLGDEDAYALPVRRGIRVMPADESGDEGEAEPADEPEREARGTVQLARRRLKRRTLAAAVSAAGRTLERVVALRSAKRLENQLRELRRLLNTLGWRPGLADADLVYGALAGLEAEVGSETELTYDELGLLLRRALGELGRQPFGGNGAGVALLSAVEARGRTFAAVFVMGLNRDVFPRLVREDPLLPDALRQALEAVLPDVPVKQRALFEERYLFASLCSAAPAVTLSWLATSDDGKERPASPLIEALRGRLAADLAPLWLAASPAEAPRPAFEHALLAGFAREPGRAEHALAQALGSESLARARRAVTEILDVGGYPDRLGPLFGFVGAPGADDPRMRELAITRLEGLAWCAWRSFLERVLGLEPPPDALAELPDATPLLVGNVVHAVLERLVVEAGGAVKLSLEEAVAHGAVRVRWPELARLETFAQEAAAGAARAEGIVQPGFARLLVRRALPLLASIRALDFPGGEASVLGAEVKGSVQLRRADGGVRRLDFRADRADLTGEAVALVDYKTGGPISDAAGADTRRRHLLAGVRRGRRLQGPAYAYAGDPVREGRYLFAQKGLAEASARVSIAYDDQELRQAFEEAGRDLLAAYELGAFPPRLLGPKRSGRARMCEACDVAEACLQGETGSRRHLAAWLDHHASAPQRLPALARAAYALLVRTEEG